MALVPQTIGILTAGGDSPGLNAAIRAVGKAAKRAYGMHVIGFRDGFRGLMQNRFVRLDDETLRKGLNFTLTTTAGSIDLLGEIAGIGGFGTAAARSIAVTIYGREHQCLDLDTLIDAKRAAGRPKDLEVIAELESIRDERRG